MFDVYVLLAAGVIGYLMLQLHFEVVPVLLGLILGPMFEENFRRTWLLSRGDFSDFSVFIDRPITAAALAVSTFLVLWTVWDYLRRQSREDEQQTDAAYT